MPSPRQSLDHVFLRDRCRRQKAAGRSSRAGAAVDTGEFLVQQVRARSAIVFLDIADELQFRVLRLQPRDLLLLLGELRRERIGRVGLRPALPRGEARELAGIAGTTPLDEMRGVQTFTTKQSTELASFARVGFLEDLPLVLRGEPSSLGLRRHFRRRGA